MPEFMEINKHHSEKQNLDFAVSRLIWFLQMQHRIHTLLIKKKITA